MYVLFIRYKYFIITTYEYRRYKCILDLIQVFITSEYMYIYALYQGP